MITDKISFGIENNISAATVTTDSELSSAPADNIKNNTLSFYQAVLGTATVTINIGAAKLIDFISLHNVDFSSLTIVGKMNTTTVFTSAVLTTADISGINFKSVIADIGAGGSINIVELLFTGGTAPKVGYVWVGTAVDFQITSIQYIDESDTSATVTRGNTIAADKSYLYRRYSLALLAESMDTFRAKIRSILNDQSFAEPRGIGISGNCIDTEFLLGVLDSGRVPYGLTDVTDQNTTLRKINATIGVREVIGGNS